MLDHSKHVDIISGKRNGLVPAIIRTVTGCLTPFYRLAVGLRNRRFDREIGSKDSQLIRRAEIPVVSVGNITTGGTGKTPMVIWFAQQLRLRGIRVCLISRGYEVKVVETTKRSRWNIDSPMSLIFRIPIGFACPR